MRVFGSVRHDFGDYFEKIFYLMSYSMSIGRVPDGCNWIWEARREGKIPLNIGGSAASSADAARPEHARAAECWRPLRDDNSRNLPRSTPAESRDPPVAPIPPRPSQIPMPAFADVTHERPNSECAGSLPPLPQVIPPAMSVLPGAMQPMESTSSIVPPRPQFSPPLARIGAGHVDQGGARAPRRVYPACRGGKLAAMAGRVRYGRIFFVGIRSFVASGKQLKLPCRRITWQLLE